MKFLIDKFKLLVDNFLSKISLSPSDSTENRYIDIALVRRKRENDILEFIIDDLVKSPQGPLSRWERVGGRVDKRREKNPTSLLRIP